MASNLPRVARHLVWTVTVARNGSRRYSIMTSGLRFLCKACTRTCAARDAIRKFGWWAKRRFSFTSRRPSNVRRATGRGRCLPERRARVELDPEDSPCRSSKVLESQGVGAIRHHDQITITTNPRLPRIKSSDPGPKHRKAILSTLVTVEFFYMK